MTNFFVSLIEGIFRGDNYIKERMERQLPPGEEQAVLGGRLLLRRHHNGGAMLGVGKKQGRLVTALSLLITGIATLIFILSLSLRKQSVACGTVSAAWRRVQQHL